MSARVILPVEMELLSDAVFGSGYSIPGGEDVAVCRDDRGLPYVRGATWKGLLRDSLEDLTHWGEGSRADLEALFGAEGWTGLTSGRRVQLTALVLREAPAEAEECFDLRAFTSLEGGVAKGGTLRTVSCVRAGLTFTGELRCAQEDLPLLRDALAGIKWAGTQRSRGFGRVRFTAGEARPVDDAAPAVPGTCLRYRLHTELPVVLTDPGRSDANTAETYGFIPGSAIRGAVMERLSGGDPAWSAHRAALLGEGTRFLDAVPVPELSMVPLPALRGAYEDKEESTLEWVVKDGAFTAGYKRAKLGTFCAPEGETLHCWSARTGGATRIQRGRDGKDTEIFQIRSLSPGQDLEGYILLEDPSLAETVSRALGRELWLGADRYAGSGQCTVTLVEAVSRPAWLDAYGFREAPGEELYLLAVSPFTMLGAAGEPCGLDEEKLAGMLGVKTVEVRFCAASTLQAGGYDRMWGCRAPSLRFYDRGSLFHLVCDPAPSLEALDRVQAGGLGVRRAEGFGQVLFLPPALVEGLKRKRGSQGPADASPAPQAELRRARYRWVMDHTGALNACGLSRSQVGTIQALCEKAVARGDRRELDSRLEHELSGRGVVHAERYKEAAALIREVLDRPLGETLGLSDCPDSLEKRLELLCLLFDHSRKGRRER